MANAITIDLLREEGINVFSFRSLATNCSSYMVGDEQWQQIYQTIGTVLDNILADNLIYLKEVRNPEYLNFVLKILTLQMLGFRWSGSTYLTEDIINALLSTITNYYSRANAGSIVKNPFNINRGSLDASTQSIPVPFVNNLFYQYHVTTGGTITVPPTVSLGNYNAATNTPRLENNNGVEGTYYFVEVAGFNNPTGTFLNANSYIIYSNSEWQFIGYVAPLYNGQTLTVTAGQFLCNLTGYSWLIGDNSFLYNVRLIENVDPLSPEIDTTPDYAFDLSGFLENSTLAKMISLITSSAVQLVPLWTKDYIQFYTMDEIVTKSISEGSPTALSWSDTIYAKLGSGWYLSPHVELRVVSTNTSLVPDPSTVNDIVSLFNYLSPVTAVLQRIHQLIYSETTDIYIPHFSNYKLSFVGQNY